jgi:hypothetical protein
MGSGIPFHCYGTACTSSALKARKRGRSDTSAAIDSYLNFKCIPLGMKIFRSQLSRHISIARRWFLLAGTSSLLLYAYTDEADEIVYVPSFIAQYIFSD